MMSYRKKDKKKQIFLFKTFFTEKDKRNTD